MKMAQPEFALAALTQALRSGGRSRKSYLRLWSNVIRLRDDNRCLLCRSRNRAAAHHICRKSFLPEAEFQTGNGITLCGPCHGEVHRGFNGSPDLSLPMDAQGAEGLDTMAYLYGCLCAASYERDPFDERFYF